MHSRIFQVSIKPIETDAYATSSDFYDNSQDFADYIGNEQEGNDRKYDIKDLANDLKDLFTLDETGEALVYNGNIEAFKRDWANILQRRAKAVSQDNILEWRPRYEVKAICDETHLRIDSRFKIEDWNGDYADTLAELISYVASKMNPGDKLYIGSVIDFHY